MDAREVIETRRRRERNRALVFCTLICGLQIAAMAIFRLTGGWPHLAHKRPALAMVGMMVFPFGWVILVVGLTYWFRRRTLKRDLAPANLLTVHGRVEKWPLNCAFENNDPEPYQFIRIPGQAKRLTVPLAFWQRLPDVQDAECCYLKGSKLVYRINGVCPWEGR
jgi:hypothetical protein